jgi:hypothetical protein
LNGNQESGTTAESAVPGDGGPTSDTRGVSDPPRLHLAQYNIARLRHPVDHPASAGFVALIDETNAHAEASPGFVWRHGIDTREVNDTPYDDRLITVNASMWESVAHLRDFAYRGFHRDVFRRRQEWMTDSAAIMWWQPAGVMPSLQACMARLAFHDAHGPSPYTFETGQQHPVLALAPDGVNGVRLWLVDRWAGEAHWRVDGKVATFTTFTVDADATEAPGALLRAALLDAAEAALRDDGVPTLVTMDGERRTVAPITTRRMGD